MAVDIPPLTADWLRTWCARTSTALWSAGAPARNRIVSATAASHRAASELVELTPIPSDLTTLYWQVGRIALPDFGPGWAVLSPAEVADRVRGDGLVRVPDDGLAVWFATDAAGRRLAFSDSRRVWCSDLPFEPDQFDLCASGLPEFLDLLARPLAFET